MAVPVLTKTYQYGPSGANNAVGALGSALANNRRILRSMVDALLGMALVPATVLGSSNGVTAGLDAVNRWAADSDLVWGAAASSHSWIVLRLSGIAAGFSLLIECANASATGGALGVYISPASGFTGGTATARPTAVDEYAVSAAATTWTALASDISSRWTVWTSTDGSVLRWVVAAGGVVVSFLALEKPQETPATWLIPNAYMLYNGAPTASLIATIGRARVNAVNATLEMTSEGTLTGLASANVTWGNTANDLTAEWPFYFAGMAIPTATVKGRQGLWTDLWYGSNAVATGSVYPLATADFVQFGTVILPWPNVAVNLS